ncbi:MAG TPA: HAD-IB family hydrolase [Spirochaetales bacterium]|nr:HAD-IB family hydrolase [Spirochaetales bacterium]HRY56156.1 HAD-IB family hydrolase [Spirochaetia bacterium]HRZ63954.1 HAD-IB family hydrolase [Spirochaetia bacterium]
MAAPIAFLDVDHTLTRRSTGYRFALEAASRGLIGLGSLALMPLLYAHYRLGKPDPEAFSRTRSVLGGLRREELEEAARAAFASRIAPDLFPAALELVASLKAAGRRVFLASSSFDFLVRPLAELLGAAGLVASELEFAGGLSTGRFAGTPAFGRGKLELAAAAAAAAGCELSACSFHSDSVHDLPLLLAVGQPVVVNPDRALAREARKRAWPVLYFRSK